MSTPTAVRKLAYTLAIASPLVVLGTAFAGLSAGGEYRLSQRAIELDDMLAESPPDIVILGNSIARTAIDLEEVKPLLDDLSVVSTHMKNSRQPAWYAILDNRVYGGGYRPKLVIVVDNLMDMLDTTPLSEDSQRELLGQMNSDDALILRKSFDQHDDTVPLALRLQRGRAEARAWVVDNLKWYVVGLLWAPDGEGTVAARGHDEANASLDVVFGIDGSQVDFNLQNGTMLAVEPAPDALIADELAPSETQTAAAKEESYFPDLARLVHEHGGRLVVVRVPAAPSNAWANSTVLEAEAELISILNDIGAGYVDLSKEPLRERDFADTVHFAASGRTQMTKAMAAAIHELGALGEGPLAASQLPARLIEARRIGTIPGPVATGAVQPLKDKDCPYFVKVPDWGFVSTATVDDVNGILTSPLMLLQNGEPLKSISRIKEDSCEDAAFHGAGGFVFDPRGEGIPGAGELTVTHSPDFPLVSDQGLSSNWVYPGTRAEFVVEAPKGWAGGHVEVSTWLHLFSDDDAPPPTFRVGDTTGELEIVAGLARSTIAFESTETQWTISIDSLPNQAYAAIRTLSLTTNDDTSYFIGAPKLEGGSSRRLIGAQSGGEFVGEYSTAPAPYDLVPTFRPDGIGLFDVTEIKFLAPFPLYKKHGLARCSPLRVLENGTPLPKIPVVCDDQPLTAERPVCVDSDELRFRPAHAKPANGNHQWKLTLTDTRECGNIRWLYPGDTLTVSAADPQDDVGADRLSLGGVPVGKGTAKVQVVLSAGGHEFVRNWVPMNLFRNGDVIWDLNRRIPTGVESIDLQLNSGANAAYFVVHVAVLDQTRPFEVLEDDTLPTKQVIRSPGANMPDLDKQLEAALEEVPD